MCEDLHLHYPHTAFTRVESTGTLLLPAFLIESPDNNSRGTLSTLPWNSTLLHIYMGDHNNILQQNKGTHYVTYMKWCKYQVWCE